MSVSGLITINCPNQVLYFIQKTANPKSLKLKSVDLKPYLSNIDDIDY